MWLTPEIIGDPSCVSLFYYIYYTMTDEGAQGLREERRSSFGKGLDKTESF